MGLFKDLRNLSEIAANTPMPSGAQMSEALEALSADDEATIPGDGLQGTAKVTSNPVLAPEAGLARMRVSLEVTGPSGPAYAVDCLFNAARMRAALLPGEEVPVKIDPSDPKHVAIEWERIAPAGMPNFDAQMKSAGLAPAAGAAPAAPAPGSDVLDRLEKLGALRDRGVLSQAEFEAEKTKILGQA